MLHQGYQLPRSSTAGTAEGRHGRIVESGRANPAFPSFGQGGRETTMRENFLVSRPGRAKCRSHRLPVAHENTNTRPNRRSTQETIPRLGFLNDNKVAEWIVSEILISCVLPAVRLPFPLGDESREFWDQSDGTGISPSSVARFHVRSKAKVYDTRMRSDGSDSRKPAHEDGGTICSEGRKEAHGLTN